MKNISRIADIVEKDQIIAMVGNVPVKATISGVIRGLIRDGYPVFKGMKIADIDPRAEQKKTVYLFRIKQDALPEGVLEVLLSCGILPDVKNRRKTKKICGVCHEQKKEKRGP